MGEMGRGKSEAVRGEPDVDFFSMGGYAAYVWPSYGVAGVILFWLLLASWRAARVGEAEVERLRALGADPRRRAPQSGSDGPPVTGDQV